MLQCKDRHLPESADIPERSPTCFEYGTPIASLRWKPTFYRRGGTPIDLVDLFSGQSIFVICNGPSFKAVDFHDFSQPGVMTFGMNNGGHLFRPNLWACADHPSRFMESIWRDAKILKFIPAEELEKPIWILSKSQFSECKAGDFPGVIGFRHNDWFRSKYWLIESTVNWGNSDELGSGRSVLLAVLRISCLLGFRRIYLVGCDFTMDGDNLYWFQEKRSSADIKQNNSLYRKLSSLLRELRPELDGAGIQVFNLNPSSNLDVFPCKSLEDALRDASIDLSESTVGMYVSRSNQEGASSASNSSLMSSQPGLKL